VTSRKETARMLEEATSGQRQEGGGTVVNLRQINSFDTGVIQDWLGSGEGEETLMNVIRRNETSVRNMVAGG
jgi:hypothetical protein